MEENLGGSKRIDLFTFSWLPASQPSGSFASWPFSDLSYFSGSFRFTH